MLSRYLRVTLQMFYWYSVSQYTYEERGTCFLLPSVLHEERKLKILILDLGKTARKNYEFFLFFFLLFLCLVFPRSYIILSSIFFRLARTLLAQDLNFCHLTHLHDIKSSYSNVDSNHLIRKDCVTELIPKLSESREDNHYSCLNFLERMNTLEILTTIFQN